MATLQNRAIEDRLMRVVEDMRYYEGITKKQVAAKCGVSAVTRWKWFNGETFPKDLDLLRTLVEACGGRLRMKIVAKDGEEFIF